MFPRESGKAPDKLLFCNSKVTKNFSFVIAGESVPVNPLEARFLQIDTKQVFQHDEKSW
jgi:hypothetical protein